nr:uncharacterized mitochondrial protein AtMg00810-like [Tanacetum cinerariifolium]
MLNKENYVPWSSHLLRYSKSKPNGKLIHNSIINGPYVRRMIPEPGDTNREVPVNETFHVQTDDELTEKELKQIEADDQAIQTILLGLLEYIYAVVDSCETAQEIWLRVQQMMKGSDIGIQEKKAKLFYEWERFTSNDGESIESYYHHFLKLMNDLKRNKYFPEKIASNLKFLNNLQPEWSRHVTIVHQTKDLHTVDYTQLYDFLKYNQKEVDELKAERLAKTQDPQALIATSNNPYTFPRISSNPRNRQIAQPGMNMGQDRKMQMVGGNANQNSNGNGTLVAAPAEVNATGHHGNQIRCYNCRGVGHFARNCTIRPKRRDAAYLHTQLLIAQKEEAGIQLQAEEFDLMEAAVDLDEIEEVNANCILMANLQQASTSGTQTDKAPVYDLDGSAEYTELLEPIPESHHVPHNDNNVTSEKMALGYQNPFYLKQAQKKQQSLYDSKVLLEKHDPHVVHDSEETLQLAQDSRLKMKQLNKEIKPANYTKINHLSRVFVSQMAKLREELYFSNTSKTANVSKTISIPNAEFSDDTTPSVARKFLNEVKITIVTLQRVVKHRMTLETHNWSSFAHQELHKIIKDEIFPIVNQADARVQNFEIQFLKEAAKFVRDFKSLIKEAYRSLVQQRALELEIERLLRAVVSQDIMCIVQNNSVVDTSNLQTELERKPPKVGETHALSKTVTSNSIPTPQESKVVKNDKVIAPGMFRINPFKPSMEEKHVPNNIRASVRTKPITVSQPRVITKKVVNSDSNGLSSTIVDNTKTRRPQRRSNTKNDRVPSASKISRSKNKRVEVEEHHRNLLLSKNKKHMSSACNNIKLDSQNVISKVVCAMCKNLEGVDLLNGDRSTNLYTMNLHDMASASPICLMARASSTKSWLWNQRLSYLNFDTINDLVSGLPKFKYHKEHLCPSCEQGKSKRASHPPKPVPNSRQRLHLLHMDLCGPMRIASINGKRYVFVIVEDYSRYTWVHFLRSKDETPEVIKTFLKRITVLPQSHIIIIIRIDNGTEFKNQVLQKYVDSVGISHQVSSVSIATACFTQNRSIIHRHFNKTPYELINSKKPNISFLHVFGALCYPKDDREDIGKLGAKGLDLTYAPSTITTQQPTEGELDLLFEAMYDDYIGGQPSAAARTVLAAQAPQVRHTNQLRSDGDMCMYALTVSTMELKNVKEAMTDPAWIESMQEELLQFKRLDVWVLVPTPDNISPLTLKWLFKNKHDEESTALYGLKQAPRAWYDELSMFLLQNHFFKGNIVPTLFIRRFDDDILVVQVYVDDIIFGSTHPRYTHLFSDLMKSHFEISIMGEMTFFLGLQVNQSPCGIFINQSNYVLEILKKYRMESCDPVGTPMEIKDKLDLDQNGTLVDATKYRSMIGSLMYLTSSRPDIVHATCLCAQYQAKPTEKHLKESWRDLPRNTTLDSVEVLVMRTSNFGESNANSVRGSNTLSWKPCQGGSSKLILHVHRNLKVHEIIIKKDFEIVKAKVERKSLALKANKESSESVRLSKVKTKNMP